MISPLLRSFALSVYSGLLRGTQQTLSSPQIQSSYLPNFRPFHHGQGEGDFFSRNID